MRQMQTCAQWDDSAYWFNWKILEVWQHWVSVSLKLWKASMDKFYKIVHSCTLWSSISTPKMVPRSQCAKKYRWHVKSVPNSSLHVDREWINKLGSTALKRMIYCYASAAAAKPLQSCLTLCDPIDGSPPGSSAPGILQARTLDWVDISFSNAWKWKVKMKSLSRARLLAAPWTAAYQAPPSMGFSRQE